MSKVYPPQFWPLFFSNAQIKTDLSSFIPRLGTYNKKWEVWGISGSLQVVYSMCTHQAHVIKNFDVQNLMTFLTIKFGGTWTNICLEVSENFFRQFFWRKMKVSSRRHLLKQKIPDYNDVSRIYRHLEKILKTRFSLIFESLGKSLKKRCLWESLGKSLRTTRF